MSRTRAGKHRGTTWRQQELQSTLQRQVLSLPGLDSRPFFLRAQLLPLFGLVQAALQDGEAEAETAWDNALAQALHHIQACIALDSRASWNAALLFWLLLESCSEWQAVLPGAAVDEFAAIQQGCIPAGLFARLVSELGWGDLLAHALSWALQQALLRSDLLPLLLGGAPALLPALLPFMLQDRAENSSGTKDGGGSELGPMGQDNAAAALHEQGIVLLETHYEAISEPDQRRRCLSLLVEAILAGCDGSAEAEEEPLWLVRALAVLESLLAEWGVAGEDDKSGGIAEGGGPYKGSPRSSSIPWEIEGITVIPRVSSSDVEAALHALGVTATERRQAGNARVASGAASPACVQAFTLWCRLLVRLMLLGLDSPPEVATDIGGSLHARTSLGEARRNAAPSATGKPPSPGLGSVEHAGVWWEMTQELQLVGQTGGWASSVLVHLDCKQSAAEAPFANMAGFSRGSAEKSVGTPERAAKECKGRRVRVMSLAEMLAAHALVTSMPGQCNAFAAQPAAAPAAADLSESSAGGGTFASSALADQAGAVQSNPGVGACADNENGGRAGMSQSKAGMGAAERLPVAEVGANLLALPPVNPHSPVSMAAVFLRMLQCTGGSTLGASLKEAAPGLAIALQHLASDAAARIDDSMERRALLQAVLEESEFGVLRASWMDSLTRQEEVTRGLIAVSNRMIAGKEETLVFQELPARVAAMSRELTPYAMLAPEATLKRLVSDGLRHLGQGPLVVEVLHELHPLGRRQPDQSGCSSLTRILRGVLSNASNTLSSAAAQDAFVSFVTLLSRSSGAARGALPLLGAPAVLTELIAPLLAEGSVSHGAVASLATGLQLLGQLLGSADGVRDGIQRRAADLFCAGSLGGVLVGLARVADRSVAGGDRLSGPLAVQLASTLEASVEVAAAGLTAGSRTGMSDSGPVRDAMVTAATDFTASVQQLPWQARLVLLPLLSSCAQLGNKAEALDTFPAPSQSRNPGKEAAPMDAELGETYIPSRDALQLSPRNEEDQGSRQRSPSQHCEGAQHLVHPWLFPEPVTQRMLPAALLTNMLNHALDFARAAPRHAEMLAAACKAASKQVPYDKKEERLAAELATHLAAALGQAMRAWTSRREGPLGCLVVACATSAHRLPAKQFDRLVQIALPALLIRLKSTSAARSVEAASHDAGCQARKQRSALRVVQLLCQALYLVGRCPNLVPFLGDDPALGPGPERHAAVEAMLHHLATHCLRLSVPHTLSHSPLPQLHARKPEPRSASRGESGSGIEEVEEVRGGIGSGSKALTLPERSKGGVISAQGEEPGVSAERAGVWEQEGDPGARANGLENAEADEEAGGSLRAGVVVASKSEANGQAEQAGGEVEQGGRLAAAGKADGGGQAETADKDDEEAAHLAAAIFAELCGVVGALQPVYPCHAARVLLPQLLKVVCKGGQRVADSDVSLGGLPVKQGVVEESKECISASLMLLQDAPLRQALQESIARLMIV